VNSPSMHPERNALTPGVLAARPRSRRSRPRSVTRRLFSAATLEPTRRCRKAKRLALAVRPQRQTVFPSEAARSAARTRGARRREAPSLKELGKLLTTAPVATGGFSSHTAPGHDTRAFPVMVGHRELNEQGPTAHGNPNRRARRALPHPKAVRGGSPLQQLVGAASHRFGFTDHHEHADRAAPIRRFRARRCRLGLHRHETRRPPAPTSHPHPFDSRIPPADLDTSTVSAANLSSAICFTYPPPISESDVPHRPVNTRPPGMLRQRRAGGATLQERPFD
jgi:hypothetical protein